jgi:preprotein translocase subunit SecE
MLQDILGSLVAVLAFAAVLYAPGYLLAYTTNLFQFRQMKFVQRSLWAIACSFCVTPIAAYLTGRCFGLSGIACLLIACTLATLLLFVPKNARQGWSRRDIVATTLVVCGWIAFVLLMLVDFQSGHKLFFTVAMADESYRIAFIDAVVRTGVPPANPLYFAGAPAPMRYYYFWYVLCAAVVKLVHVTARQSYIASCIWAGFGLLVTVRLYVTHFFRWERKQRWTALALLLVSGADLLPAVGNSVLQPALNGDIEWWSVDPIDAWPDSLLWVPHHVASVLCCLLVFLFLWRMMEPLSRSAKYVAIFVAGLACASALGLSVYVAFGFALLMSAWLLRLLVQRNPQRKELWLRTISVAGISAIIAVQFLWELAGALHHPESTAIGSATSSHFFIFSVRRMIDSGLLIDLPFLAAWNQAHPVLLDQAIRLLLLLPGLAMELGIYGAVLVLLLLARQRREPALMQKYDARDTALFFAVAGLVMTMFISSSVISNNDFGYRAVMLPQFFLLLLAADVLGSWWVAGSAPVIASTPGRRRLLYSLLALGTVGFLYGAFLLRAWLPMETARPQNGFSELPDDSYQVREAFASLDRVAPRDVVVNFDPIDRTVGQKTEVMTPDEYFQRMLVMDTGRQMLNAERICATHFGGNPSECAPIQKATVQLYALPAPDAQWARDYCSRFGTQYLVVSHRDPAWESSTGWPVTLPVVAQEPGLRILQCNK